MTERFRSLPIKTHQLRVDRASNTIYGVSVAQAVEAKGHGVALDAKSLDQIIALGNASTKGVKSRFTHPGLSADGLGKYLGRLRDFRRADDKAVADLHLSPLSAKSPDGDLSAYVMDMAEQEPDMFGMSVVVDMDRVWCLADGTEIAVNDDDDDGKEPPAGAGVTPVARIRQFIACDAVDEPAANRDGLFSSSLWATNQDAERAFAQLDEILSEWGVGFDKAYSVALRYFDARGVKVQQEFKMAEKTDVQPVTPQQFTELQQQFAGVKDALAASEAKRAETEQEAKRFAEALDKSNARIALMEAADQRRRFSELCKDWYGKTETNVNLLVKLSEAFGEDTQEFKDFVTSQNAVSAQLAESSLFKEIGTSRSMDNAGTPGGKIESLAQQIAKERKVTIEQARVIAADENPRLYIEYIDAHRKGA